MSKTLPLDLGRGLARITKIRELFESAARYAYNYLRLTGVTVDTNTVTIGTDVWEVDTIGTAVTPTLTCTAGATTLTLTAHGITQAQCAAKAGVMIKAAAEGANTDEILQVVQVLSVDSVRVKRARSGTAASAHAAAVVTKTTVTAGNIALGVLSTSAANFCTAFLAEVNAGDRGTDGGSNLFKVVAFGTTSLFIVAKKKGVLATVMTETLANGTLDNATAVGGVAEGVQRRLIGARVPTAAEVTAGLMLIPCEFTPASIQVRVVVTGTGILGVAWNGAALFTAPSGSIPGYVTLDNAGTADWAATDTVHYIISE